jgi:hypothetical protein
VGTIVGMWGETRLVNGVDNTPSIDRCSFNTSGFTRSSTAAHVFDLGGASGPKLDFRGNGYTNHEGDWFNAAFDHKQRYTFSTWTGTGMATLSPMSCCPTRLTVAERRNLNGRAFS